MHQHQRTLALPHCKYVLCPRLWQTIGLVCLRNWFVGMFSGERSLPRVEGSSRFGRLWQVPTTNLGLAVAELMLLWHLFRFLIVQVIVRFA